MALETLTSTELLNFIINNTINSGSCNDFLEPNFLFDNVVEEGKLSSFDGLSAVVAVAAGEIKGEQQQRQRAESVEEEEKNTAVAMTAVQGGGGKKKRRRRERVCKNKEEAENQRMTHIAVERNRRKMMNEHLAVLRSLMPESYAQRGDQASVVGGAIEFVKELEQHLQTLEAQKFLLLQQSGVVRGGGTEIASGSTTTTTTTNPFSGFFTYPQYICSQLPNPQCKSSNNKDGIADIEVTLIETHANIRIFSRKRVKQLSKLVTSFHSLYLTILHLNITTLESMVLYSLSAKVEEGCLLSSADDIAGAVHHILRIIEETYASLCCQDYQG